MENKIILTYGTFDLLHKGHKNIILYAIEMGGSQKNVHIGVSSDKWNKLKGKIAYEDENVRIQNLRNMFPEVNIFLEDHNHYEESWKDKYISIKADLIIMGDDHKDKLAYINEINVGDKNMKIIFTPRTKGISSSMLREEKNNKE